MLQLKYCKILTQQMQPFMANKCLIHKLFAELMQEYDVPWWTVKHSLQQSWFVVRQDIRQCLVTYRIRSHLICASTEENCPKIEKRGQMFSGAGNNSVKRISLLCANILEAALNEFYAGSPSFLSTLFDGQGVIMGGMWNGSI